LLSGQHLLAVKVSSSGTSTERNRPTTGVKRSADDSQLASTSAADETEAVSDHKLPRLGE